MPKLLSERGKASPWGLLPLTQQVWGLQVKVDALPMVQAALGHWGGDQVTMGGVSRSCCVLPSGAAWFLGLP